MLNKIKNYLLGAITIILVCLPLVSFAKGGHSGHFSKAKIVKPAQNPSYFFTMWRYISFHKDNSIKNSSEVLKTPRQFGNK